MASTETWFVEVGFVVEDPIPDSEAFDALSDLDEYGAAMSLSVGGTRVEMSLAVEADTPLVAIGRAEAVMTAALEKVERIRIVKIQVRDRSTMEQETSEPTIPDLVGYAEIAQMAGVSRQRARQFNKIDGFPVAVVETAAGPLRLRASIEAWLRSRNTRPGRPAAAPPRDTGE